MRAAFPWRSQGEESFGWWDVPGWLGPKALFRPRREVAAVVIGTGFWLGFGPYSGSAVGAGAGVVFGLGAGWLAGVLGPPQYPEPFALVPRWPRTAREVRMLAVGVAVLAGWRRCCCSRSRCG